MDEARLTALERICQKATPGPWRDLQPMYLERCKEDRRQYKRGWWHGTQRECSPLSLIVRDSYQGEPIDLEDIPRRVDKFDLTTVIELWWSELPKKTTMMINGHFKPEDAAFIVAARSALPEALEEIRRLRAALADVNKE